jgi:hypothetical protein
VPVREHPKQRQNGHGQQPARQLFCDFAGQVVEIDRPGS